jgi:diadenylate cyclase
MIGSGSEVDAVCSGGFFLDGAGFTAQRLAELAKMDGGIVISEDGAEIVRANVHFIPDPSIATDETGTRFRTAERLAAETGCPVLAVSEEGRSVATVYTNSGNYELQRPTALYTQANQTLTSIERLRRRLQEAEDRLTRLEVDDVVTVRDVAMLIQRAALVRRLYAEVEELVIELGREAKLISIQAADLIDGVDELAELTYQDYAARRRRTTQTTVFDRLAPIAIGDLYDAQRVATELKLGQLDDAVHPRGIRALSGVPRLPETVRFALVSQFHDFQRLLHATVDDFDKVPGVGGARARRLHTYFARLTQIGTIAP